MAKKPLPPLKLPDEPIAPRTPAAGGKPLPPLQLPAEPIVPVTRQAPPPPMVEQPVDDVGAQAVYANFCRVVSNPEELMLDFGLQREVNDRQTAVKITQRIVLSHLNAQRLHSALTALLQQHYAVFAPQQPPGR